MQSKEVEGIIGGTSQNRTKSQIRIRMLNIGRRSCKQKTKVKIMKTIKMTMRKIRLLTKKIRKIVELFKNAPKGMEIGGRIIGKSHPLKRLGNMAPTIQERPMTIAIILVEASVMKISRRKMIELLKFLSQQVMEGPREKYLKTRVSKTIMGEVMMINHRLLQALINKVKPLSRHTTLTVYLNIAAVIVGYMILGVWFSARVKIVINGFVMVKDMQWVQMMIKVQSISSTDPTLSGTW